MYMYRKGNDLNVWGISARIANKSVKCWTIANLHTSCYLVWHWHVEFPYVLLWDSLSNSLQLSSYISRILDSRRWLHIRPQSCSIGKTSNERHLSRKVLDKQKRQQEEIVTVFAKSLYCRSVSLGCGEKKYNTTGWRMSSTYQHVVKVLRWQP